MTTEITSLRAEVKVSETPNPNWNSLYKLGGVAALLAVLTGLVEIIITFLPGGNVSPETVSDWFTLFQNNWFLGFRNLGLLNIVLTSLAIPIFLALYAAHRQDNPAYAVLAMILSFIGVAVFFATNRAFPMLSLSSQYASAATDAQRSMIAAAGQAMLAVGQSHTPGTFIGFFLSEVAGITISVVMLQSKVFSKAAAYTGILGFGLLLIFEVCASFAPASGMAMVFAMSGGILTMVWYTLIARRLYTIS
jgi:hypothetical protein